MVRWTFSWLLIALVSIITAGCASSRPGVPEGGSAVMVPPVLSMSMTRTVPTQDVHVVSMATETVDPLESPLVSAETGVTFYRLKVGDPVVVHLRGIYPRDEMVEDVVDEDGNVTLPLLGDVLAAGKSTSQLEADIRRLYIDGGYYRTITVSAMMPSRIYFIRGEIRNPGRFPIIGGVTIMQAIAAAGGYTEFANQRSIKLIRGESTTTVNMRTIERNPERDIRLESGDVIVVDRTFL